MPAYTLACANSTKGKVLIQIVKTSRDISGADFISFPWRWSFYSPTVSDAI
jgi:hypothetical protein